MPERILNSLLTCREDLFRIPGLSRWMGELAALMQGIKLPLASHDDLDKYASLAKQSSLLLYLAGEEAASLAVCTRFTDILLNYFKKTTDPSYLKTAIHVWINSARLDRLQGKVHQALGKLQDLDVSQHKEFRLRGKLFPAAGLDAESRAVVMSNVITEHCKAWLVGRQYPAIEKAVTDRAWSMHTALGEALVISQVAMGSEKALETCLTTMKGPCSRLDQQVFYLRLCELAAYSGELSEASARLRGIVGECSSDDLTSLRLLSYAYACLKRWSGEERSLEGLRAAIIKGYEGLGEELGLAAFLSSLISLHGRRDFELPGARFSSLHAYLAYLASENSCGIFTRQLQGMPSSRASVFQAWQVHTARPQCLDELTAQLSLFINEAVAAGALKA